MRICNPQHTVHTEHQRIENFLVLKHYYLPQKYSHTIFTFDFATFELLRLYNLERILPFDTLVNED
jgi:hypothetical protein